MEDSRRGKVTRDIYYDEILGIPEMKKILNIKDETIIPAGTCPPVAKAPLAMLATTFGTGVASKKWSIPLPIPKKRQ